MNLTLSQVNPILKYIIKNNKRLQEKGQVPIAVCLESEAGIGKSLSIKQLADELGYNYVKLNVAMISEQGDILGFPIRLNYVCKPDGSDCQWITPELISDYSKAGYEITPETKMGYALPEWYKSIDQSKDTILLLDDWTRKKFV